MDRDHRTFAIIGAAMEVHHELGHGFLEAVYQSALAYEFTLRNIPFSAEANLSVHYKGQQLPCGYRADFICYNNIVVELKAVSQLLPAHQAQLINELKATQHQVGLLLNFGAKSLEHKRMVRSRCAFPVPPDLQAP